jgi:hypothetical protein
MAITFPLTVAAIKTQWERKGFSCVLSDEAWQAIVDEAMMQLQAMSPIRAVASFNTVADEQDYFIYDTEDATTGGIAANALKIEDVLWNPGGDWSSLNLFSPGWQLLSHVVLFAGGYFHQPSQMVALRQKLNDWKRQFGSQGFSEYGMPGDPEAFIQLYPVPQEAGTKVLVVFTKKYVLADVTEQVYRYFRQWVDYYAAEALAAFYSQTAGVEFIGFTDSREPAKHWRAKAEMYLKQAHDTQAGISGQVERT